MDDALNRNKACRLASGDPAAAKAAARKIDSPWHRTQALGYVARYCAEGQVEATARESLAAAALCKEDYRRAMVSSWPIRALAERGRTEQARHAVARARDWARGATPISSRAEVTFQLLNAAWELGPDVRELLVNDLLSIQGPPLHWRVARGLARAVEMLAQTDRALTESVIDRIRDRALKARSQRALDALDPMPPGGYGFFH